MVVGEHPLKDAYRLLAWGPWRWALERSPPGWELRASRALGRAASLVARATSARARANLARAFPDREDLDDLAARTFAAHFANQQASFAFARVTRDTLSNYVVWEGLEHLEAARTEGVGVVLVHAHLGVAQLPLCALGVLGYDVHQVGGGDVALEKSRVGRWASATRARLEQRLPATLHDGRGYLRAPIRALRGGAVVLTAGDGTGGGRELGRRVPATLFGLAARMPITPVWLARHGGARLHPLVCVAEGARHRATIGPAMRVPDHDNDAAVLLAGWLEGVLRAHPEEWLLWDAFCPGQILAELA